MRKIWIVILFLLPAGCGDPDLLRFDKLGKPQGWEPDVTLLLAKARFSLWDAFYSGEADSATLKKDENGCLFLEYGYPGLFALSSEDFFPSMQIDNIRSTVSLSEFSSDEVRKGGEMVIDGISPGLEKATIYAKTGIRVINNARLAGNIRISFKNLYHLDNLPLEINNIRFTPAGGASGIIEIPGAIFVNENGDNKLKYEITLCITGREEMIQHQNVMLDVSADVTNIKVWMKLQDGSRPIPPGLLNPDMNFLNSISGDIRFENPELRLIARSRGMGIDFRLKGEEFCASNGKDSVVLSSRDEFRIQGSAAANETVESVFVYGSDNSNVNEFASLPPSGEIGCRNGAVTWEGGEGITLFQGGTTEVGALLHIPLAFSASDLIFTDTIRDLNMNKADSFLDAVLFIEGENGLKAELQIPELCLLDENGNLLERIMNPGTDKFEAATDSLPSSGTISVGLNRQNLDNLAKAKHIAYKVLVNSPDAGEYIRINDREVLDIRMRIQARVDMGEVVSD